MKKIEEIMTSLVKNNCLVAANLELNAFSYPMPGREGGKTVERFFLYSSQPHTRKSRPHAWIVIDSGTGGLLQYNSCESVDFAADLRIPLGQTIDYSVPVECNHKELRNMQRQFAALYAQIREFAFGAADHQGDMLSQYRSLLEKLTSAEVRPFYRLLSPEFFGWLEKETGEL